MGLKKRWPISGLSGNLPGKLRKKGNNPVVGNLKWEPPNKYPISPPLFRRD